MKRDKKPKIEQLDLSLKEPITNRYYYTKEKIEGKLVKLRHSRIYKHWATWFSLTLLTSNLIIQFLYITNFKDILPNEVPLFNFYSDLGERLINKQSLTYAFIASIVISVVSTIVYMQSFYTNKTLSVVNQVIISTCVTLFTYNLIRIFINYV